MCQIRSHLITLFFFSVFSFAFGQSQSDEVKPLPSKGTPGQHVGVSSGEGGRATPQHFTGISKPLPGESRFRAGEVEKPKRPIPGTAVYPVTPSAWYPGVSRARINAPINQEVVLETLEIQSGDYIDSPTLAPQLTPPKSENGFLDTLEKTILAPRVERRYQTDDEVLLPREQGLSLEAGLNGYNLFAPIPGSASKDETIYDLTPFPLPERFHPVAGDPEIPLGDDVAELLKTGPPRALRYGLVSDAGVLNAPYAPGQAAPKVWSNGRAVTMTERAQLREGYAPIIRSRKIMARHTNVATSLPTYCDGLEHCPKCMRAFLCGCGEDDCRFCNPESRVGPAPLCSCCGDARPCIHGQMCKGQLGHAPYREFGNTSGGIACPICKERVERIPCGFCEKCKHGETCELYKPCGQCPSCLVFEKCDLYRAERNCVLPNRTNSCNRCDNTIHGEPCGTCDWCRENSGLNHEPCGHQEVGIRPKTIYNPYNEPKLFSAPSRFVTDRFNNGASRFPIYYNPAPYYKETSNPSLLGGYARPFTFRYTCAQCMNQPCTCTAPGLAGQVAYAYACKLCNRNPCACAAEICNVNMALNPAGVKSQLEQMREDAKPKLPWQQATAEDGGFKETPEPSQSDWGMATPPPGSNNATDLLPAPQEKEPLPFEEDPNTKKTDLDLLFEKRN
ncbi:MAG: hypothetical protein FWC43_14715 [Planctomycetaceae bacterium]|nr:hypothetical protein [Planctomycetaceae bacterium]